MSSGDIARVGCTSKAAPATQDRVLIPRRRRAPPLGLWVLLGFGCWLLSVLVLWLALFVAHDLRLKIEPASDLLGAEKGAPKNRLL